MLTNNMKILLGLAIVLGILYYYNSRSEPVKNQGSVKNANVNYPAEIYEDSDNHLDPRPIPQPEPQQRLNKPPSNQEEADYEWSTYFGDSNKITGSSQIRSNNSDYRPTDETEGQYAMYDQPMKKRRPLKARSDESDGSFDPDMYDPDNLLPQENDLKYFEVIDSQVSLKGRLLRPENPLGINTVGVSRKFASHDLRPVPLCPKFGVSPWNNSTAEPDTNIKTMY
jgi:hypothetical protein